MTFKKFTFGLLPSILIICLVAAFVLVLIYPETLYFASSLVGDDPPNRTRVTIKIPPSSETQATENPSPVQAPTIAAESEQAPEALVDPVRLAVCPFGHAATPGRATEDSAIVADLLTGYLLESPRWEMVSRTEIDQALDELALNIAQLREGDNILRVGRMVRADFLVTGAWIEEDSGPSIIFKMIDADTGVIQKLDFVPLEEKDWEAGARHLAAIVETAADRTTGSAADQKFVAIGGFADESINDSLVDNGEALRRFLEAQFSAEPGITMVARSQVKPLLLEATLGRMGLTAQGTPRDQAQPAFVIVDGRYHLYRKDRTIIALDVRVEFVGRENVAFTLESEDWKELQARVWRRLNVELTASRDSEQASRHKEAEAHYQRGIAHTGLKFGNPYSHPRLYPPSLPDKSPQKKLKALRDGIDAFESAILLDPGHLRAMLCLAVCLGVEEIGEPERARNLYRQVAAQSKDEDLKFIAAEKLGVTDRLRFSENFAHRVFTPEYKAKKLDAQIKKLWAQWGRAHRAGTRPPVPLAEVLAVYDEAMRAHLRSVMWKAKGCLGCDYWDHSLYLATSCFGHLARELDADPAIAAAWGRIVDWLWQDYPRLAPHLILACNISKPIVAARVREMVARLETGEVQPLKPVELSRQMALKIAHCASEPDTDYETGRVIGEYLIKHNSLSYSGKVFLAYCLYGLGEARKAIALLESVPIKKMALQTSGPWGKTTYTRATVVFRPSEVVARWRQEQGMEVAKGPETTGMIYLGPPVVELPPYEWVQTVYSDGRGVWLTTNLNQNTHAPLQDYRPRVYRLRNRQLQAVSLPFPLKGMLTSMVVEGETLWLGTDEGLFRLKPRTGQWQRYTEEDGLLLPAVSHLQISDGKLYVCGASGVGYIDLADEALTYIGLATRTDIKAIAPSPTGIWALLDFDGVQHFDATAAPAAKGWAWDETAVFCIAATENRVVVGKNLQQNRMPGIRDVDQGGLLLRNIGSARTTRMPARQFPEEDIFALAFVENYLWVGGRGFIAALRPEGHRILSQTVDPMMAVRGLTPSGGNLWVAAQNRVYYIPKEACLAATKFRWENQGLDKAKAFLPPPELPAYDDTPASLQKIQDAVMPAACQNNAVARRMSIVAMTALAQDVAISKLLMKREKLVRNPELLAPWVAAVEQRAAQGDPFYRTVLALMYCNAEGVERDGGRCLSMMQEVSADGFTEATFQMSMLYKWGAADGAIPRDSKKALAYALEAAGQGSAMAFYLAGGMYMDGEGVSKNLPEGLRCMETAAEMGVAGAQYNMGDHYLRLARRGSAEDQKKADRYYQMAGDQGHPAVLPKYRRKPNGDKQ